MAGHTFTVEVEARLPEALSGLRALSENLLYAWDRHIRGLFWRMDAALWERCGHNPKVFLRRISQQRLDELAEDAAFLEEYNYVLGLFSTYRDQTRQTSGLVAEKLAPETAILSRFVATAKLWLRTRQIIDVISKLVASELLHASRGFCLALFLDCARGRSVVGAHVDLSNLAGAL